MSASPQRQQIAAKLEAGAFVKSTTYVIRGRELYLFAQNAPFLILPHSTRGTPSQSPIFDTNLIPKKMDESQLPFGQLGLGDS